MQQRGWAMRNKPTLHDILAQLGLPAAGEDLTVNDLCLDTRAIQPGDVFIALSGFNVHGLDYAYQAERAGAVAVITEPVKAERAGQAGRQKPLNIPLFNCAGLSDQLGELASFFYGHPSEKITVTAITGTNGKTSVAWLLMHALQQLGIQAAYIGTLGIGDANAMKSMSNTTPSAIDIQKNLAAMVASGYQHVCVEVSSHALDQNRFKGTAVDHAVFTNLSRDHLDYHKTMKAYATAKLQLFSAFGARHSIINVDDEVGLSWVQAGLVSGEVSTYGMYDGDLDYQASDIHLRPEGIAFTLHQNSESIPFKTALLGGFNVHNSLAVIAVLRAMGHDISTLVPVVAGLQPVPGRMNRIDINNNDSIMVVDYAHTPDALEQVLKALRAHTDHKLWCVFGCGGNRDKGKRAMMGAIAEQHADQVVLTDDNPRFESSAQIIADIEFGMQSKPHVINDRRQAIAYAIDHSQTGDIILLAGKGHESTQEINGELLPFADLEVVKELLQVAS